LDVYLGLKSPTRSTKA
jgi:hypothetical protein